MIIDCFVELTKNEKRETIVEMKPEDMKYLSPEMVQVAIEMVMEQSSPEEIEAIISKLQDVATDRRRRLRESLLRVQPLINDTIKTDEGKTALANAMVEPIRRKLEEQSIMTRLIPQLPDKKCCPHGVRYEDSGACPECASKYSKVATPADIKDVKKQIEIAANHPTLICKSEQRWNPDYRSDEKLPDKWYEQAYNEISKEDFNIFFYNTPVSDRHDSNVLYPNHTPEGNFAGDMFNNHGEIYTCHCGEGCPGGCPPPAKYTPKGPPLSRNPKNPLTKDDIIDDRTQKVKFTLKSNPKQPNLTNECNYGGDMFMVEKNVCPVCGTTNVNVGNGVFNCWDCKAEGGLAVTITSNVQPVTEELIDMGFAGTNVTSYKANVTSYKEECKQRVQAYKEKCKQLLAARVKTFKEKRRVTVDDIVI